MYYHLHQIISRPLTASPQPEQAMQIKQQACTSLNPVRPRLFSFAGRKPRCLMIANETKFNSASRSARLPRRKSQSAPFMKNAGGAHIPHTDLFAGAEMEAVSDQKLKD